MLVWDATAGPVAGITKKIRPNEERGKTCFLNNWIGTSLYMTSDAGDLAFHRDLFRCRNDALTRGGSKLAKIKDAPLAINLREIVAMNGIVMASVAINQ